MIPPRKIFTVKQPKLNSTSESDEENNSKNVNEKPIPSKDTTPEENLKS